MNIIVKSMCLSLLLATHALAAKRDIIVLKLSPAICQKTSQTLEDGRIPTPEQVAKDAYCARQLLKSHAAQGALSVFGSARTVESEESYKLTREFARLWTQKLGTRYPIMTGGGLGIMEAANRGAWDAGGQSISIAMAFANAAEKPNRYSSYSYLATSFSQRESDLIDYASAIVIAPGGFGTEWEIYESLSKIQTLKKKKVPLILLGGKDVWDLLLQRVEEMKRRGTISPSDFDLVQVTDSPAEAVRMIETALPKLGAAQDRKIESQTKTSARPKEI